MRTDDPDPDYRPTNRELARRPRGRAFWCGGCDGVRVWAGQKCPRCGCVSGKDGREKPGRAGRN